MKLQRIQADAAESQKAQTRVPLPVSILIDEYAEKAGVSRYEAIRHLLETGLVHMGTLAPATPHSEHVAIMDALGIIAAKADEALTVACSAERQATAAHAAAKLAGLMLLPASDQQTFLQKLAAALPPLPGEPK